MEIRISQKRYKIRQILGADKGDLESTINLIAGMVYDSETKEYLPPAEARAMIEDLDGEQFEQLQKEFMDKLEEFRRAALPLATGKK